MFLVNARTWMNTLILALALSIVAVALHALPYHVPEVLREAAERFASPGELLWWTTLGGVFAGYPSGWVGYTVWILGTTVFWLIVSVVLIACARIEHAALRRTSRR